MLFFSLKIKKCYTYLCLIAMVDPAVSIVYVFKVDTVVLCWKKRGGKQSRFTSVQQLCREKAALEQ